MLNLTRRAAIVGALASTTALAVPASAAMASLTTTPAVSPELTGLLDRYFNALRAERAADETSKAAYAAFKAALKADPIRIRLSRAMAEYLTVDADWTVESIRKVVAETFEKRVANVSRLRTENPSLASLLDKPERLAAEYDQLRARAEEQIAAFQATEDAHGIKRLDDEASAAWEVRYAAQEALFAYRPQSLTEAQAIADRFLDDTDQHRSSLRAMPTDALLRMFAGRAQAA
jgi:hypothetical protein